MKGQITEISCGQVHVAGAFTCNFIWNIAVSEFNTEYCISFNGINNLKAEGLVEKLWCENKDHPRRICWYLSVGCDIKSVCFQHSS